MIIRLFFSLILLTCSSIQSILAEEIDGKVIRVIDGDGVEFIDSNSISYTVRLSEIDAPEFRSLDTLDKNQSFGEESKNNLIELCEGKQGVINVKGKDRYGRDLAILHCEDTNANIYQLKTGMAWVFDLYVTDYTYYKYQNTAKKKNLGLWSEPFPLPPWEFRKGNKSYDYRMKELEKKYEELKTFTDQQLKIYEEKITELTQNIYELLQGNMNINSDDNYNCAKKTCSQMSECSEAYFQYQQCGNTSLDRDKDGVPCESICN